MSELGQRRHRPQTGLGPLCPQERTSSGHEVTSVKGQSRLGHRGKRISQHSKPRI
jgi:hypothetical protein